ncbi:MAG: hypothetical protein Q7R47_04500 [Candidatus Diapherotrites archaeon]|nr:hypothetical protein [Candidatus Diapherotrites archaeon]
MKPTRPRRAVQQIRRTPIRRRPSPLRPTPRKPEKKRIRVSFWCLAGQEASFLGKKTFDKLIRTRKLGHLIQTDYHGIRNHTPQRLRFELSQSDFVIPMYNEMIPLLKNAMQKLKRKPILVDVGIHHIHDQYDATKYRQILRRVLQPKKRIV